MAWLATLIAVLAAYLLGSISFAVVTSRLFGLADPRTYGSRNPGATNVLRTGNKAAATLTLAGDALKGAAAVWLAQRFGSAWGIDEIGFALVGGAAFVGHLYPLYFGFRGGKGVATFLGVVLALYPALGLFACGVWLLVAYFLRYSSLASICAGVLSPLAYALGQDFDAVFLVLVAISALLVFRHQQNIRNLVAGTERKIGQRDAAAAGGKR
jgi:glycerol-3-phosphate acyltransferase PlsY